MIEILMNTLITVWLFAAISLTLRHPFHNCTLLGKVK